MKEVPTSKNVHYDTTSFCSFTVFEVAALRGTAVVRITIKIISNMNLVPKEPLFRYHQQQFLLCYNFPGYGHLVPQNYGLRSR